MPNLHIIEENDVLPEEMTFLDSDESLESNDDFECVESHEFNVIEPENKNTSEIPGLENHFNFGSYDSTAFKMDNIVVTTSHGKIRFQGIVTSKNCLTHTTNRRSWHGPVIIVRVYNFGTNVLVEEWEVGRINLLCTSNFSFIKHKNTSNITNALYRVQISISPYRYSRC